MMRAIDGAIFSEEHNDCYSKSLCWFSGALVTYVRALDVRGTPPELVEPVGQESRGSCNRGRLAQEFVEIEARRRNREDLSVRSSVAVGLCTQHPTG